MNIFLSTLLLQYFSLTYTVDAAPPINPTAEDLHKVVLVSKSEFMRPITTCEINNASNGTVQNTYNIVYTCTSGPKRHQLFGF